MNRMCRIIFYFLNPAAGLRYAPLVFAGVLADEEGHVDGLLEGEIFCQDLLQAGRVSPPSGVPPIQFISGVNSSSQVSGVLRMKQTARIE